MISPGPGDYDNENQMKSPTDKIVSSMFKSEDKNKKSISGQAEK